MVEKIKSPTFFFFTFFFFVRLASAEVMFEGYSILRAGTTAIGYTIQRYEFDSKKKIFTSTSFLRTNEQGGDLTESTKAVSNQAFQPVSYQYVTKTGGKAKMIDAKFAKNKMTGTLTDGKAPISIKLDVKKGTFLSTFLGYLMLQNGLKADKTFTYSAIAEEDGAVYTGEAIIKTEEEYKGQKAYRIVNTFKGTEFISFVSAKGEVLGTRSPTQNLSTELVANASEATKGFQVPSDTLKILFGNVPTGKTNALSARLNVIQGSDSAPTQTIEAGTSNAAGKLPSPKKPDFNPAPKSPAPIPGETKGQ